MGFQQSINQALYTGTIGAGLYSRSPAGQADKIRQRRDVTLKARKREGELGSQELEKAEEQSYEAYELHPSKKNLKEALKFGREAVDMRKLEHKAMETALKETEASLGYSGPEPKEPVKPWSFENSSPFTKTEQKQTKALESVASRTQELVDSKAGLSEREYLLSHPEELNKKWEEHKQKLANIGGNTDGTKE